MSRNLSKIITFVIIASILGAIVEFILICKNQLTAPENLISEKKYAIEIGDKTERFKIETYSDEEGFSSYVIRRGLKSNQKLKLTGFEKDVNFLKENSNNVEGQELLVLYGDVGAHAQNVQVINVTGSEIKTVHIDDPNASNAVNTYTDVPNFKIENNLKGLAIDSRDYDKDPTLFSKRTFYKWFDSHFVFDRSEDISYNKE